MDPAQREREVELFLASRRRPLEIGKPTENDIQTSLRMSRALYDALLGAAQQRGVGVGEEIRQRLDSTFALALGQPETGEFVSAIMHAAHQIERAYGHWRADPFAFRVFNTAISTLLAYYTPKGEPTRPATEPGSFADTFFGPEASPEAAGRAVAMAALTALGR